MSESARLAFVAAQEWTKQHSGGSSHYSACQGAGGLLPYGRNAAADAPAGDAYTNQLMEQLVRLDITGAAAQQQQQPAQVHYGQQQQQQQPTQATFQHDCQQSPAAVPVYSRQYMLQSQPQQQQSMYHTHPYD